MKLSRGIVRELREAILSREYRPGEHLVEMALCKRFGVSRTPVREALQQLEREGFVRIVPGVGARVAELSVEEILKVYDVLIALDSAACRLACAEITEEELDRLAEYSALMGRAADEGNADLVVELNNRFHWLITEAAHNTYLLDMRAGFRRLVDPITRHFPAISGQIDASLRDHQAIITALRNRNAAMAEFVMRDHLENAKKNLKKYLKQQTPSGR